MIGVRSHIPKRQADTKNLFAASVSDSLHIFQEESGPIPHFSSSFRPPVFVSFVEMSDAVAQAAPLQVELTLRKPWGLKWRSSVWFVTSGECSLLKRRTTAPANCPTISRNSRYASCADTFKQIISILILPYVNTQASQPTCSHTPC